VDKTLSCSYGTVKWFNKDTGRGCIVSDYGVEILFCYRDIQTEGLSALDPDARVTYVEARDDRGIFATYIYLV